MLVCVSFAQFCTRDRGCSAHPVFPAPSDWRVRKLLAKLGQNMRRDREVMHSAPPSLHALCAWGGREPAPDLIRGRGWGVYQLVPLAASLLRHPPPPTPPRRCAGGGEELFA